MADTVSIGGVPFADTINCESIMDVDGAHIGLRVVSGIHLNATETEIYGYAHIGGVHRKRLVVAISFFGGVGTRYWRIALEGVNKKRAAWRGVAGANGAQTETSIIVKRLKAIDSTNTKGSKNER